MPGQAERDRALARRRTGGRRAAARATAARPGRGRADGGHRPPPRRPGRSARSGAGRGAGREVRGRLLDRHGAARGARLPGRGRRQAGQSSTDLRRSGPAPGVAPGRTVSLTRRMSGRASPTGPQWPSAVGAASPASTTAVPSCAASAGPQAREVGSGRQARVGDAGARRRRHAGAVRQESRGRRTARPGRRRVAARVRRPAARRSRPAGRSDCCPPPSSATVASACAATDSAMASKTTTSRAPASSTTSSTADGVSVEAASRERQRRRRPRASARSSTTTRRAGGTGCSRQVVETTTPSEPCAPGVELAEVVAGDVLDDLAAGVGDRAVGQHDGDADEQVADGAVAQPARAGGVRRQHAAERRARLGRVEGEPLPGAGRAAPAGRRAGPRPRPRRPGRRACAPRPGPGRWCRRAGRTRSAAAAQSSLLRPPAATTVRPASRRGAAQHLGDLLDRRRADHLGRHDPADGVVRRAGPGRRDGRHGQNTSPRPAAVTPPTTESSPCTWTPGRSPHSRGVGKTLPGFAMPAGVERAAHELHRVEVLGRELLAHLHPLLGADAVLAGDRAAGADAQLEDVAGELLGVVRLRPRRRCRTAPAGAGCRRRRGRRWRRAARRASAICPISAQHLGQLGARDDAVLHEVGRADPADGGERRLAALPHERPLGRRSARCGSRRRAGRRASSLDLRRTAPRPRPAGPSSSITSTATAPVGVAAVHRGLGRLDRERVHHLDRGRQDARRR